jgi:hypothetical protein
VKDLRVIVVLRVPPEPGVDVIKLFFFVAAAVVVFSLSGAPFSWAGSWPYLQILDQLWKSFVRDKCSGLFCPKSSDEEKNVLALTPGVVPVVLGPSMSRQNLNNKAEVFLIGNYTC